MKQTLTVIIAAAALAGCATQPEVLPEGKDSYLLILSSGYSMASSTELRLAAHRAASAFCGKTGKRPETITEKSPRSGIPSDSQEEELKFRCVEGAAIIAAPAVEPARPASGVSETPSVDPR